MKRRFLRGQEIRELAGQLATSIPTFSLEKFSPKFFSIGMRGEASKFQSKGKKDRVEQVEDAGQTIYLVNGEPGFFFASGRIVPSLRFLLRNPFLKKVTVDMGAIKFVTSGADVMRPGITSIEPGIEKGELVLVIDQQHGKPLAVGEALLPSEEMQKASSGKVVRNLHWVGDKIWNFKHAQEKEE